jgi:hypothetical protein
MRHAFVTAPRRRGVAVAAPGQLSLDDELARMLEPGALQDWLAVPQQAPRDGAHRLLRRLVQRGLSEPALPAAAALVVVLDAAAGVHS